MGKISQFRLDKQWIKLPKNIQDFITEKSEKNHLSFQDIKQLIDISIDLIAWDETTIESFWPTEMPKNLKGKEQKSFLMNRVKDEWNRLKNQESNYSNFNPSSDFSKDDVTFINIKEQRTILGDCPVASERTRCCNLKTLDSVINCGFDCSYCTIQSFYKGGKVLFEKNLKEKLSQLDLDSNRRYHIGTGQSSDSLMWGNRENNLTHLFYFAQNNPNIILELKTKSNNVEYLLENPTPKNIIVTWSLNPQTIIDNEEHLTASLEERLEAAKEVHDKGILVGFHFHPMVYYKGWQKDYTALATRLMKEFCPERVAMISIGTLTFIKPVIKQIRSRDFKTKILQMPLRECEGKFSYTYDIKKEMFSHLYNAFTPWHGNPFFYMCMEEKELWMDVFGREYSSNEEFEEDMINSYFTKIED